MILRPYIESDADHIVTWIEDEKTLYQWSADRLNEYPLKPDTLNQHYQCHTELIPFTACNEAGTPIGHFFLRYPDQKHCTTLRIGFVIVDPVLRGKGYGKQLLQLAKQYSFEFLRAEEITLGVFSNNPAAYHCYKAIGFHETGTHDVTIWNETWKCIDLIFTKED